MESYTTTEHITPVCFFPTCSCESKVSSESSHWKHSQRVVDLFARLPCSFIVMAAKAVVANWDSGRWEYITERHTLKVFSSIIYIQRSIQITTIYVSHSLHEQSMKNNHLCQKIELYKNFNSSPHAFSITMFFPKHEFFWCLTPDVHFLKS